MGRMIRLDRHYYDITCSSVKATLSPGKVPLRTAYSEFVFNYLHHFTASENRRNPERPLSLFLGNLRALLRETYGLGNRATDAFIACSYKRVMENYHDCIKFAEKIIAKLDEAERLRASAS